jgi:hypothetical protein
MTSPDIPLPNGAVTQRTGAVTSPHADEITDTSDDTVERRIARVFGDTGRDESGHGDPAAGPATTSRPTPSTRTSQPSTRTSLPSFP